MIDTCYAQYSDPKNLKTEAECKEEWADPTTDNFTFSGFTGYSLCIDHSFEKTF